MRVSVVAVVTVVAVDRLDVGERTAVIVENEPLMAELVAGTELDAGVVLGEAAIVENEPLLIELVAIIELDARIELDAGTELEARVELDPSPELDTDGGLDEAVIVENEPLMTEFVVGDGLDATLLPDDDGLDKAVFPEDDTADDEPVVDTDEGGGPVPARMRTPTLIVLAALLMAFCADRR